MQLCMQPRLTHKKYKQIAQCNVMSRSPYNCRTIGGNLLSLGLQNEFRNKNNKTTSIGTVHNPYMKNLEQKYIDGWILHTTPPHLAPYLLRGLHNHTDPSRTWRFVTTVLGNGKDRVNEPFTWETVGLGAPQKNLSTRAAEWEIPHQPTNLNQNRYIDVYIYIFFANHFDSQT